MTNEFDTIEFIEAYYRGSLDKEQLARFQELMQNDPDFEAEVQDYALLFEGFDMLHTEELNAQMTTWEARYETPAEPTEHTPKLEIIKNEFNTKKTTPLFSIKYLTRIAAAVAFLVFIPVAYFALFSSNRVNVEEYINDPGIANTLNLGDSKTRTLDTSSVKDTATIEAQLPELGILTTATEKYNHKEFEDALQLFTSYEKKYAFIKEKPAFVLYVGICKLATDDVEGAIQYLKPLTGKDAASSAANYQTEAEWMLALAYYRNNDHQNARTLLETIADNGDKYHEKAAKLLRQLDK